MKLVLVALVLSANAIAQIPEPAAAPAGVPGSFTCTAAGKAPYPVVVSAHQSDSLLPIDNFRRALIIRRIRRTK